MRRDDEGAFVRFATSRRHALRSMAYLLCGDWSTAEDLTQTALVRLYTAWGRLDSGHVEPYARRVLVNAFIDETRRPWRRRETLTRTPPDTAHLAVEPDAAPADDVLVALRGLPKQQRAVIVLRYWNELSLDEIAQALSVSRNTVKTHLARALATLRLAAAQDREELEGGAQR